MRRIFIVLGLSLVALGVSLGGLGVTRHAPLEHMLRVPLTLAGAADGHELLRVRLEQGQSFYAELCAEGMTPRDLAAASFVLRHVDEDVVVREVSLDARFFQHLRAVPSGVCGLLVSASSLGIGGDYAIALRRAEVQPRAASQRLELRLVARSALSFRDHAAVWCASLGALLLLLGLALGRPSRAPAADDPGRRSSVLAAVAFALLVALLFGAPYLVPRGASGVYLQGLLLASAHVVLAVACASKPRLLALGLASPMPRRWLVLAPLVGLGMRLLGAWLSRVVPSTGVAPVQELVSMPSGMLAFATLAVLAPVAEELFFRGLLYGVLEARFGRGAAVFCTTLLFALVHLPQQWGAWGAFLSVALLGLALSLLRRWSGGSTAPALAHLVHNAVVTLMVLS